MKRSTLVMGAAGLAAMAVAAQPAGAATLVNVQFSGANTFSGAGVIGAAGDVWNRQAGSTGTGALVDAGGAATAFAISYAAQGSYTSAPSYTRFTGTPLADLMQSYLHSGTTIGATFSGLAAGQKYTLYAVTQGDDNTRGRTNRLTVNGATQDTVNTNASTLIEGDNYAVFTGRADGAGHVTLADLNAAGEANLNGLQLQVAAVPEPAAWALMIGGVGMVGGGLRRRRAQTVRFSFG